MALLAMRKSDGQLIATMLAGSAGLYALSKWDLQLVAAENGLLEDVQLVLLVTAAVLFAKAYRAAEGAVHSAAASLFLLTIALTFRELDFRHLEAGDFLQLVTGRWRDYIFFPMLMAAALYALGHLRDLAGWLGLVRMAGGWCFPIAIGLLALAHVLDDIWVTSNWQRFWEELVELNADVLLATSGWRILDHVSMAVNTAKAA